MAATESYIKGGGGTPGLGAGVGATNQPNPGGTKTIGGLQNTANNFTPGATTAFINNMTTGIGQAPITPRQNFFNMLERWETTLPLTSLWMVFFKIPQVVTDQQLKEYGELPGGINWGVDGVRSAFGGGDFTGTYGCALAQTVGIPVEQLGIDTVGPVNRGFLKGPVVQQRQSFAALNIEFLETTLSFNDFLLRPWIILTSHLGLVHSSKPERRVTTDVYVVNLSRAGTDFGESETPQNQGNNQRSFIPRKIWLFQDCIPVNIGQETYTYGQSEIDRRDTEWSFRRYQVIAPQSLYAAFGGAQLEQPDLTLPPGNPVDTTKPTIERKDIPNLGYDLEDGDPVGHPDAEAMSDRSETRRGYRLDGKPNKGLFRRPDPNDKPTNPRRDTPGQGELNGRGIPQRRPVDDLNI